MVLQQVSLSLNEAKGNASLIYRCRRTVYENTGLVRYLETSRRMATFFLNAMPDDGIVPW